MARMTVHMLGIMYFHVCEDVVCDGTERQVLLPDGRTARNHIPPHNASLFIEESRYDGHEGDWPGPINRRPVSFKDENGNPKTVTLLEFQINEPVTLVTFPDGNGGTFKMTDLDKGLLPLRTIDPDFKPDLSGAGSIARVPIRSGKLQSFMFNNVSPVQWTIDSGTQPLQITAKSPAKNATIRLKTDTGGMGTEVVLANAPDLLAQAQTATSTASELDDIAPHAHGGHGNHDEPHHFSLYNKIRVGGPSDKVQLPPHRMTLPNNHGFFKAIEHMKIMNSCTGTCCPGTGG